MSRCWHHGLRDPERLAQSSLEIRRGRVLAARRDDQVLLAPRDAQAIYAADKLAKARELRPLATRLHASLTDPALQDRLEHYERSLETLDAALPGMPLVTQLRFELWAIRQLPPG